MSTSSTFSPATTAFPQDRPTPAPEAPAAYTTSIADSTAQIRAAQRLRHRVFGEEMGATLHSPLPGHDVDDYDDLVDHLIVTETATGEVVGTYRLLPPGRSERLYSDGEFDLSGLRALRPSLIEAGRSCVHPDHRTGAVINQMWAALARYTLLSGHRYLAGCASVPLADGGACAAATWELGRSKHAAPEELRVRPHRPWLPDAGVAVATAPAVAQLPPLLRGYLRVGAWICGAPAHDPEFDVADFFVVLDMDRLGERYRRFFLGDQR
ncbi:GNAT family N-acetyltransferase [Streptomyces sp. NPDC053542]|uniref:GNAT family N-acetyltransferase n=1 Tax=Streptomyces sp. NPDC053542 TaxID=3365710 RepID=UPI0037D5FDB1